jgi:hypothetical protein
MRAMRGVFSLIGGFFGQLWRFANFWRVSPVEGVRTGSKLAGGLLFLALVFGVVGVVLVTLGFDLDQVDLWLDAQGGWMDVVGKLFLRGVVWFVFLCCVVLVLGWAFDRKNPERPGWGVALGAALVGLFCSASLFAPL